MLVFSKNKAGKGVACYHFLIYCCLAAAGPSTFSEEKTKMPVSSRVQQENYVSEPGLVMLLITWLTELLNLLWERAWRQFLRLKDSGYEDPSELHMS